MASSTGKTVLWGGIFLLSLLSVITPLGIVTLHFLLVPLLVLAVISKRVAFALTFAGVLILPWLLLGGVGSFLSILALFYLAPALAMARQYRKEAGSASAVFAGVIAFIAVILIVLLVAYAFRFNLADFTEDALKSEASLMAMMESLFSSEDNVEKAIGILIDMIPVTIIFFSVYTTVLAHWLGRKLLSRYWKPVPRLTPMKDWRLPKSMIWYYLILIILDIFIEFELGSTMNVILLNAVPLLTYALALQGIGFLFFTADAKGWNRAMPITGIVLMPFFPQLIAWIGVIDTAFPLRSRMKSKE